GKPANAAKTPPPGAKPPAGKGEAAKKPPVKAGKPQKEVSHNSGGHRKIGQVFVDLGFIDEDQIWEILDEAKSNGQLTGQVALSRGLINEDQLLQALAEQQGLKVISLEETKPQPEALAMVPETMATVYKILPISLKENVLTVATGDPSSRAAFDDLRNFLGVKEVIPVVAPARAIEEAATKPDADKKERILDLIQQLEQDSDLGSRLNRKDTSIDLESLMEIQEAAPVRKLLNMVMLLAIKDRASDIHFEPFEEEYKMRY